LISIRLSCDGRAYAAFERVQDRPHLGATMPAIILVPHGPARAKSPGCMQCALRPVPANGRGELIDVTPTVAEVAAAEVEGGVS
jgi:hypothetical protein